MDPGDDAHGQVHRDQGAATVADKGQRQTDDREGADAHADIDRHLEDQLQERSGRTELNLIGLHRKNGRAASKE